MEKSKALIFMHSLLKHAKDSGASDIFITTGFAPAIKVDGKIAPVSNQPLSSEQSKEFVYSLMNERQAAEFSASSECNFAISVDDVGRFRVNAFVQQGHCGMILRKIEVVIPSFESLKIPSVLKDISLAKRGLVIFVGGTGSGKSTSLAAFVDWRNRENHDHIITLEDPIEYVHAHKKSIVTQREIGVDSDSWEIALKNTLRQAPDMILMGEIRDRETMGYAMQFAETGHLCVATLHANNANQAMDRILNFFPEERHAQLLMDLSSNMRAIISQRLIPLRGGKGRAAAVEVLLNTPLIADLIFKGDTSGVKEVMSRSTDVGMQTFDKALFDLYESGRISYEDALRNADSMNDLRLKIKLEGTQNEDVGDVLDGLSLME
jgi:twitching motility protein PilU